MSDVRLDSASTRNIGSYRLVHAEDADYGKSSEKFLWTIVSAVRLRSGVSDASWPQTILDFGCGKSTLVDRLALQLNAQPLRYDPAIEEYQAVPCETADLVINTDVLEHLDEGELDLVLRDIARFSKYVFFNISTRPAAKMLPNGENAHATVKEGAWWRLKLQGHFSRVVRLGSPGDEVAFITWDIGFLGRIKLLFATLRRYGVRSTVNLFR